MFLICSGMHSECSGPEIYIRSFVRRVPGIFKKTLELPIEVMRM
jgi:hypothetical protein